MCLSYLALSKNVKQIHRQRRNNLKLRSFIGVSGRGLDTPTPDYVLKEMPMTLVLFLGTVAHEGYMSLPCQLLNEAKRKLLAVILNRPTAKIDWPVQEQLCPVFTCELGPRTVP